MLPVARRALIIGLVGPAIQALGFLWLLAHLFISHLHDPIDPRHLFFEGGFLTIGAGLLIAIVCIPVALEVGRAAEEDIALKQFEPRQPAAPPAVSAQLRERRALRAHK